MATLKTTIFKNKQRSDGTWLVYVQLYHDGKHRYLPTSIYVDKKDITSSFRIKNAAIMEKLDRVISELRKRINGLDIEFNGMDIDQIIERLKRKTEGPVSLSDYFEKIWLPANGGKKRQKNYATAMNAYKKFLKRSTLMATDVTTKLLKSFEKYLEDRPRAVSMYTSCMSKIFADACEYYNDADNGIYLITHNIDSYHAPKQNVAKKRALPVDVIRRLFALGYDNKADSRHDLALDCFRLSFCLLGMNSADLYEATDIDGNVISYCRQKTKDRRNDRALMKVEIPGIVRDIVEKYRDDKRVFNFYTRYSSASDFNKALNIGLKAIGKELGVDGLQFYSARHSMATIAVNKAGIDRWTVNAMLNHTDTSMHVTELYIERDFSPLNKANRMLLEYVFGSAASLPYPTADAKASQKSGKGYSCVHL